MDVDFLSVHCPRLKLIQLVQHDHGQHVSENENKNGRDQQLVLTVISTAPTAHCPLCQIPSSRIHCYYPRVVQDLSWVGLRVQLQIRARRFVCSNMACPRRTFAERLGEQIPAYAHRTKQSKEWLQAIGLALGGKAGARLAKLMKIPASPDTLLRSVRAVGASEPERPPPRVLGIDDSALRKGQKYATILVDLEHQRLVDLLPDREKGTVIAWLNAHYPEGSGSPGLKVVSRDRGGAYAEAVREVAPQAVQVADRFHLAQNLGEMVERVLRRYSPTIHQVFGAANQGNEATYQAVPIDQGLPLLRHEADKAASQMRRMAVYEHVNSLAQQGYNLTDIAEQLRMSRKKIRQLLEGPPQPPVYKEWSKTKIGPYKGYLRRRFSEEGCANSLQLYRELREQGYDGCRSVVTNYVTQLRQEAGLPAQTGKRATRQPKPLKENVPAPGQIRWWFLLPQERLSAKQQEQLARLCEWKCPSTCLCSPPSPSPSPSSPSPSWADLTNRTGASAVSDVAETQQMRKGKQRKADFALLYQLAQSFLTLLHEHTDEGLTEWLAQMQKSGVPELLSFAAGIGRDEAAVRAGLRLKWSQGPVEGAVNRVKLIKRSMYGRANFDLLRTRVLCSA